MPSQAKLKTCVDEESQPCTTKTQPDLTEASHSGAQPGSKDEAPRVSGTVSHRPTESNYHNVADFVERSSQGQYGVISLFDGVWSVLPILTEKIGYPPKAIVLVENDASTRELVCAVFGLQT